MTEPVQDEPKCCKDLRAAIAALETTVKELRAQAAKFEDRWQNLALKIAPSGDGTFLNYQKFDHNFVLRGPSNDAVLVGWGYGATNHDACAFYKTIELVKKP